MCRVIAGPGLRWTQQRRAREAWAGRVVPVSPRLRADERRCEFVSPAFSRQRRLGREIVRRMSVWQNRATGFGALAGCQIPSVAVIRPENKAPEIVSFRDVADSDSNPWR